MSPAGRASDTKKPNSTTTAKRRNKKAASQSVKGEEKVASVPTRKPPLAKTPVKRTGSTRATRGRGETSQSARTFRLTVHPAKADTYGVSLSETPGTGEEPATLIVTTTAAQTGRVLDAVLAAVKGSGHQAGRLAVKRDQPIPLDEAEGVRLAVILLATQPITANDRVRRIVAGVNFMSIEETYYWYAKCVSTNQAQARKAIRILLADPNRQD